MTLRVGQKVVRNKHAGKTFEQKWIDEGYAISYPKVGDAVTIKTINEWPDGELLTFCEHDNSFLAGVVSKLEPGFPAKHFSPEQVDA